MPDDVVATMTATIEGLQINSAADAAQTALEWLPISAPSDQAQRLAQMIHDGTVRIESTWSADGKQLELSLVKVPT